MRRLTKLFYILSMLACIGGIVINWQLNETITWPAIALFWCITSFGNEFKKYE